ncbi:MAG: acyl-CoA thioester hydrolase/BAAT C-terminal domain-containing protein [Candidatus Neomarinimicrobiota bacterium]
MRKYLLIILMAFWAACGVNPAESQGPIVSGVDLGQLFATPTATEVAVVESDWVIRDIRAVGLHTHYQAQISVGEHTANLDVISHTVGGIRHYGAVLMPLDTLSSGWRIICILHGGDTGVSINEVTDVLASLQLDLRHYVIVIPSFRGEALILGDTTFISPGTASPWDYDVDDALALISACLSRYPQIDSTDVGLLGISRGAGVALLMAIRDPMIDRVVDFFGPTDFFDEYVQIITREVLEGNFLPLPGLDYINETVLEPLSAGTLSIEDARLELVRRSAVLFATRLPRLQIHHGRDDLIVAPSQTESLMETLTSLGADAPPFEAIFYPQGGHNAWELEGALEEAGHFLQEPPESIAADLGIKIPAQSKVQ